MFWPITIPCLHLLIKCIDSLYPANRTVVICGDFNLPDVDWLSDNCFKCNDFTCAGIILSFYYKHGLEQFITEPTRSSNVLDLVFSNDANCILNVDICDPFSTSDHNTVLFDIVYRDVILTSHSSSQSFLPNFYKADWASIKQYLTNVDFYSLFNVCDIALICDLFYNILYSCINLYVPLKPVFSSRKSKSLGLRYPYRVNRLINKKAAAWRSHRLHGSHRSRAHYNKVAAKCRRSVREFTASHEKHLIDRGNIGAFYRYANNKFSTKSSIGIIKSADGSLISDSVIKAEIFHRTFSSYFTVDNNFIPASSLCNNPTPNFDSVVFSQTLVRRALIRLKTNSAGGPDRIPPIFLKRCANELSSPIAVLFNLCFSNSYLPPAWLTSFITPVLKKGSRTDPANYRPIALTCTLCKVMEYIIKNQMIDHLQSNNLISRQQHAFMAKFSTCTNLLECTHDWLLSLNSSICTDIVYIDFSRAFDSIVHSKLLHKLNFFGISGYVYSWIENFLLGRTQRVVIDYVCSDVQDVISGVPQGSVLGPILFLLYINDIDSICDAGSTLKLFADDCKLYSVVSLNNTSISLQLSLDSLCTWANAWQLIINVNK